MKWIPIEDKKPVIPEHQIESEDVLVVCVSDGENRTIDGRVYPNLYRKGEVYQAIDKWIKWRDLNDETSFRQDRFFGKVTHWMPLPKMPKIT